jgi:hypothetical protein
MFLKSRPLIHSGNYSPRIEEQGSSLIGVIPLCFNEMKIAEKTAVPFVLSFQYAILLLAFENLETMNGRSKRILCL